MQIQTSPQQTPARPPREHWNTGAKAFDLVDFQKDPLVSTADLLQQANDLPLEGVPASYTFQRDCAMMKPATAANYGSALVRGAAGGALVGALGGLALELMGGVFTIMTAGFFGHSQGIGLLVPAAVGSVVGAGISALDLRAEHQDYPHYGESISGNLRPEYGPDGQKHLFFHPRGELNDKVELEKFQNAPIIEGGEVGSDSGQWWQKASPNVFY